MTRRRTLLVAFLVGCSKSSNDATDQESGREDPKGRAPAMAPRTDPVGRPDQVSDPPAVPLSLGTCEGPPGRTLRTLIVGNSQIYFWDLPRLLSELSATAPSSCPRIAAEGFTRGGQNLRRLWEGTDSQDRKLDATIRDGKYDVVVISECIDLVELPPPKAQFVTYADLIIDAVRASGAMPVLYATPYADQHPHKGFLEMAEPQLALGLARDVRVAAGGLAWLRVWKELPELDLHHADHAHPGYKGSIVSAMVIYSVITRGTSLALAQPTGGDCEPRPGRHEPCPPVTTAEADVFRNAAWAEAVATGMK